jgi:organic anion transporter 4A
MTLPNGNQGHTQKRWIAYAMVLFATTLYGIVVAGFVNTSFSTLERRFNFSSTVIGVISGSSYVGLLLVGLPVSILAEERGAPKLRFLAGGLIFIGLGSLLYGLPHFIISPVVRQVGPKIDNICADQLNASASQSEETAFPFEVLFILGNTLHGIGAAPFYPVGYTYLSESILTFFSIRTCHN